MELPERKHPRLKNEVVYASGSYFITICTHERRRILSRVVGRGLAPAEIVLTEYGKIAEEQLFALEERFSGVKISKYVIMPDHIHMILFIHNMAAGASPRPTAMDVMCAFKSLTTRECKKLKPIDKLFQSSFMEHVIRNEKDYEDCTGYIYHNPSRWWRKYNQDKVK